MTAQFDRLLRFIDTQGVVRYGEAPGSWHDELVGRTAEIAHVLSPLPLVPLIYGVGLNYKHHIAEAGFPTPEYPVIFTKPYDSVSGPCDDIPFHTNCLELDYEGELCVVIGKEVKNFNHGENPLDYVLGYMVGNDVSSRYWQNPLRSGGQHEAGKSFDKFAPLGPVLLSSKSPALVDTIEDGIPSLQLRTTVNGEVRQSDSTGDLLFRMSTILSYLSLGRTLRQGTVIMTGTPSGVAAFMQPPQWLQPGDTVEIGIETIGMIRNRMMRE